MLARLIFMLWPLQPSESRALSSRNDVVAELLMFPLFAFGFCYLWLHWEDGIADGYDEFFSVLGRLIWFLVLTAASMLVITILRVPQMLEAWCDVRAAGQARAKAAFWLPFAVGSTLAVLCLLWNAGVL